jgi:hypothetical protein
LRILRGQGGDDGHPVAAKRGEGFEIRRDACAATWIKTRYREKILDHVPAARILRQCQGKFNSLW